MTREQFLNELKAALNGMKEEELEGVLSYYGEMIDDRVEAGMTEEAAVKAMEPVKEIAGRVLEEAGMAEEKPKNTEKGNWQRIARPADSVALLRVQAECKRIRVITEEDAAAEVCLRYCIGTNDIYQLHEDGGVLTLEHKIRPVSSFVNEKKGENLSLEDIFSGVGKLLTGLGERIVNGGVTIFTGDSQENEIEITLPHTFCGKLHLTTSNARISVEDLTATQPMVLSTSNSRIVASNLNCAQDITFTTSNGRIVLDDVNVNAAHLTTSNSRIELEDVFARDQIVAATSNSGISAEDTEAGGLLSLSTSNGRVELSDVDARELVIKTSNGSVSGSVKGKREEYTVSSSTSNGANQLGSFAGGDKTLRVVTSNASIALEFGE